eukprot:6024749-Pleurochrysis_carterae.AAC.1
MHKLSEGGSKCGVKLPFAEALRGNTVRKSGKQACESVSSFFPSHMGSRGNVCMSGYGCGAVHEKALKSTLDSAAESAHAWNSPWKSVRHSVRVKKSFLTHARLS